ncbi:hypothetical protein ABEB36_007841 [Hypothenemus hampei]|uniref:Polyketide synthase C-terminal extension domain-containing protein n=1 Tax=Hypothenemus hampei TaxID=57062 RepID=A0ABD1EYF2_HYPHA
METDNITPNINYNKPRKNLDGLLEGAIKLVNRHIPFPKVNGIVGVSSSGFGGGNAHAVLQRCGKTKKHNNIPQDNLTRLVCVSGRTEEAVQVLLDDIQEKFDLEHIHNIFRKPIKKHPFRGYLIASKDGTLKRTITKINFPKKASIIFGDFTDVSGKLLLDLLAFPLLSSFNNE